MCPDFLSLSNSMNDSSGEIFLSLTLVESEVCWFDSLDCDFFFLLIDIKGIEVILL